MYGLNPCQENSHVNYTAQHKITFDSTVKVIQNPCFVEFLLLVYMMLKKNYSFDIIFDE